MDARTREGVENGGSGDQALKDMISWLSDSSPCMANESRCGLNLVCC